MKSNWTKHNKQEWSIDISDLTRSDFMPDGTSVPGLQEWETHRDPEGEITKWTLQRNGKTFTIFND
jgi:hypothetical protein